MPLDGEVDQPEGRGVLGEGQHPADVRRGEVCVHEREEDLRQACADPHELVLVARTQDGSAQGERAAPLEPYELLRRHGSEDFRSVEHHDVIQVALE